MLVSTMSPGDTPPCAIEGSSEASSTSMKRTNRTKVLEQPAPADRSRGSFTAASLTYDLDFLSTPTKLGPVSEPSSWRAKSTVSPLHVTATLLLAAFHVQCSISPLIVRSALPPERSSSITLPPRLL